MTRLRLLVIGWPPLLLAIGNVILLVLSLAGRDPVWRPEHVNVSEAVALTDAAEAIRLIGLGNDPHKRYPIRPGLVPDSYALGPASRGGLEMTPMEAAVAAARPEIVALLFDEGVVLSEAEWRALACGQQSREVTAVLLGWPGRPQGECR